MLLLCVRLKLFQCRFVPLLKPRPLQCSLASLARVPKVNPSKNPRSANVLCPPPVPVAVSLCCQLTIFLRWSCGFGMKVCASWVVSCPVTTERRTRGKKTFRSGTQSKTPPSVVVSQNGGFYALQFSPAFSARTPHVNFTRAIVTTGIWT